MKFLVQQVAYPTQEERGCWAASDPLCLCCCVTKQVVQGSDEDQADNYPYSVQEFLLYYLSQ